MTKVIAILISFSIAVIQACAAVRGSDGSQANVNAQITAASNGDTVLITNSGSYSWSTSTTLSSSKYITLDGSNSVIALTGSVNADPHATGLNRITAFTFNCTGSGKLNINDTASGGPLRLDHCTITGTASSIVDFNGQGAALMDHCTFTGLVGAQEFIHIWGWGAGVTTGWTTDVTQGSTNMLVIEDCTFRTVTTEANCAWIQSYYGARICYRYNLLDYTSIDAHGTAGNIGTRWWEIYMNKSTNASGDNVSYLASLRAGSGVIFSNSNVGAVTTRIGLCEENSGWPADYQIGRGKNQTSDIAYQWGNSINVNADDCDAPEVAGMVVYGRDVTNAVKTGYTALTYPHPLIGGGSGGGSIAGISNSNTGTLIMRR